MSSHNASHHGMRASNPAASLNSLDTRGYEGYRNGGWLQLETEAWNELAGRRNVTIDHAHADRWVGARGSVEAEQTDSVAPTPANDSTIRYTSGVEFF